MWGASAAQGCIMVGGGMGGNICMGQTRREVDERGVASSGGRQAHDRRRPSVTHTKRFPLQFFA
jgi:hypothetical protein